MKVLLVYLSSYFQIFIHASQINMENLVLKLLFHKIVVLKM